MPAKDSDLLARLNALKPTSVSLEPKTPAVGVEDTKPQSLEDRLASRLKNLRAGNEVSAPPSRPEASGSADPAAILTAQVRDEVAAESDPIRNWQTQDEDEQSLEELLAELGPESQWKLDPEDPKNIDALLKEAKDALPAASDQQEDLNNAEDHLVDQDSDTEAKKTEDQQDEEEADQYVQRLLAALEVESKYGGPDEKEEEDTEGTPNTSDGLNLPSTPSTLPEPPAPKVGIDDDLEARFSKLAMGGGLNLPSTPTGKPSSKPSATSRLNPKSNLPTYTDEDIDSWCCICNEDGAVRCLGCDGDLYCQACWSDGHGTGPGQERGHKAVLFSKGEKKKKRIAA